MPLLTHKSSSQAGPTSPKLDLAKAQALAKQKSYERQIHSKKIKLEHLTVFTQQLAAMLDAGLPLVAALEALQDQVEDPVMQLIVKEVRMDVSTGTAFSAACAKFPNAFPNLFTSMVQAGEASGNLGGMLAKVSGYFGATVKLVKKVKSAMTYPITVISIAVALVNVLLIFVIPVFGEMFRDFGSELPAPTQMLLDMSDFMKAYWWAVLLVAYGVFWGLGKLCATPKGRVAKDRIIFRLPVVGQLSQRVALSRFCRTYAILLRSGVPILTSLEICGRASGNTFIEQATADLIKHINQGGQFSEVVAGNPYFPSMIRHMSKAGEQTGNVDAMMEKISDFYDVEIENTIASLTSLMEPMLITFLGAIIGGIVMAMFMPIFQLSSVVGG
jgi:type IV pilus assembly protein PilC